MYTVPAFNSKLNAIKNINKNNLLTTELCIVLVQINSIPNPHFSGTSLLQNVVQVEISNSQGFEPGNMSVFVPLSPLNKNLKNVSFPFEKVAILNRE